jgi:hypothetical protein
MKRTRFNEVAQNENYSDDSDPDHTKKRQAIGSKRSTTNLKLSTKSLRGYIDDNSEDSSKGFSERSETPKITKKKLSKLALLDQSDSDTERPTVKSIKPSRNSRNDLQSSLFNKPIKPTRSSRNDLQMSIVSKQNKSTNRFSRNDLKSINGNDSENSNISEVNLSRANDKQDRELMLLAKIKLYKNKLGKKNELISSLKESIDSDIKIKQMLEQKINDLKVKMLDKKAITQQDKTDVNGIF